MPISRKLRNELLEGADGVCSSCKQPPDWRGLAIHHKKLKGMGGSKLLDGRENLETLCGKCHAERHGIREHD